MFAVVSPRGQRDPLKGDRTLHRHFEGRLFDDVPIRRHASWPIIRVIAEVPFNLGNAVIGSEKPLAEQPLQHTSHAGPVD